MNCCDYLWSTVIFSAFYLYLIAVHSVKAYWTREIHQCVIISLHNEENKECECDDVTDWEKYLDVLDGILSKVLTSVDGREWDEYHTASIFYCQWRININIEWCVETNLCSLRPYGLEWILRIIIQTHGLISDYRQNLLHD